MKLPHAVSALAFLGSLALPLAAGLAGCAGSGASVPAAAVAPPSGVPVPAAMPADRRMALFNEAFDVASLIPADPHAKDRAKAQEAVVLACLEAGFVAQSEVMAMHVDGWRRGEALGLIGQRFADAGDQAAAKRCAAAAAEAAVGDNSWTGERVLSLVAGIYARVGDEASAGKALVSVPQRSLGAYEAARAPAVKDAELDAQAESFDRAFQLHDLDFARGAFEAYCAWLDRVQADPARRARALKSMDDAIPGFPLDLQVVNLCRMADWLSAHGDRPGASARIARAAGILAETKFQAEDVVPLGMEAANARIRAGDAAGGRADIERLRREYDALVPGIVNLRRGISLRALAEGWALLGERDAALRCWAEALDAGVLNPNSRPRAEDLSATIRSMAAAGIPPTTEMRRRIDTIRAGLADPW